MRKRGWRAWWNGPARPIPTAGRWTGRWRRRSWRSGGRYPTWGPKKLRVVLATREPGPVWPAASSIGDLLRREGVSAPRRRPRYVPPLTQPLADAQAPNDVWSADFKGWFRTADGTRCDPLTVTDACSRFVLCCQITRPSGSAVWPWFERTFRDLWAAGRLADGQRVAVCVDGGGAVVAAGGVVAETGDSARIGSTRAIRNRTAATSAFIGRCGRRRARRRRRRGGPNNSASIGYARSSIRSGRMKRWGNSRRPALYTPVAAAVSAPARGAVV